MTPEQKAPETEAPGAETVVSDRNQIQTLEQLLQLLAARREQFAELIQPLLAEVQLDLYALEGLSFDDLEANTTATSEINALLNLLNVRVRCMREACNEPSRLRCSRAGAGNVVFSFRHQVISHRETHCGTAHIPHLELIAPPQDQRRKKQDTAEGESNLQKHSAEASKRGPRSSLVFRMQSEAAFQRALPDLLQTHRGQFAAFHGDECIAIMSSKGELNQQCIGRGLQPSQFIIREILPVSTDAA